MQVCFNNYLSRCTKVAFFFFFFKYLSLLNNNRNLICISTITAQKHQLGIHAVHSKPGQLMRLDKSDFSFSWSTFSNMSSPKLLPKIHVSSDTRNSFIITLCNDTMFNG